jgi:uncharacterized protein YbaR (Trm112 family)
MLQNEEFRVCPECGYQLGFHVFFRKAEARTQIGLICPQCGSSYDIGWISDGLGNLKPEKGFKYK